jgi:rhodanese-related sulfurtransferase
MSDGQPRRLDARALNERMQGREPVVVLDVRTADARRLHPEMIPGARWVPLSDVSKIGDRLARNVVITTYCT